MGLKKEFLEGLNIFFANRKPKLIIENPISKLKSDNIVIPEISVELILKTSNIPFKRNINPNIKCTANKVHIFLNISTPLIFCANNLNRQFLLNI